MIEYLLENGYLEIGKTELIYKFDGKTVIIMLEGNRREYQYRVGIGEGDYDGKQEVEAFGDKYGRHERCSSRCGKETWFSKFKRRKNRI